MTFQTVFASGESSEPDAAYTLAERSLREKLDGWDGRVEHAVTAVPRREDRIDPETLNAETRRTAVFVVTLLATVRPGEKR